MSSPRVLRMVVTSPPSCRILAKAIRAASLDGGVDRKYLLVGLGIAVVLFLAVFFIGDTSEDDESRLDATPQGYDGGFPVPPMPTGGAVRGAAATLTFDTGRTVAAVEEDQTV